MAKVVKLKMHWLSENKEKLCTVVCQNNGELKQIWLKNQDKNFKVEKVSTIETMGVGYDEVVKALRVLKKHHDIKKINRKDGKGGYLDDGEYSIRTIHFSFSYPYFKYSKKEIEEEIKKYKRILGKNFVCNFSENTEWYTPCKNWTYDLECDIITNGNFTFVVKDFLKGEKLKTYAEEERDRMKSFPYFI